MVALPKKQFVDEPNDAPPTCPAIQHAEAVGADGQGFRRPAAQHGVNQLVGGNADGFGVSGYFQIIRKDLLEQVGLDSRTYPDFMPLTPQQARHILKLGQVNESFIIN